MTVEEAAPDDGGRNEAIATLASLVNLVGSDVSGVLLIEQVKPEPPVVSQLVPTAAALPALTDVVQKATAKYVECEVIDYDPAEMVGDGQVMWIDAEAVPLLRAIVDESADLAGVPMYDPDGSSLKNLQLAAMRVEGDGVSAVAVQSLRGNQIVARSRRVGLLIRRGVIDLPPQGQILLFSKDVAAIVVGSTAFFRDRAGFQRLFGYLEELQQQAGATFLTITTDLRIEAIDDMLVAVLKGPSMLGKMASIQRKLDEYPKYRAALTMPNLLKFIASHPECGVEISGEGDAAALVFHKDPQHRFKILNLLDDDYLHSELTSLEYQANSKSAPIGGT